MNSKKFINMMGIQRLRIFPNAPFTTKHIAEALEILNYTPKPDSEHKTQDEWQNHLIDSMANHIDKVLAANCGYPNYSTNEELANEQSTGTSSTSS